MSFVRTILGDVAIDRLRCCGAHEHTIIDAPYIAEKHPDFLLDDIDAACTDLREFRDAGGGWMIDTMPTGAGRCTVKLATVSQQSAVHIVCPTGLHLPLYYPPDDPLLSMHREELVDVFVREIVDGVCEEAGPLPYRAGVVKVAGGQDQLTPHQRGYGGKPGLAWLLTVLPVLLRERGVEDNLVERILIHWRELLRFPDASQNSRTDPRPESRWLASSLRWKGVAPEI